jgi:hypothetical protein
MVNGSGHNMLGLFSHSLYFLSLLVVRQLGNALWLQQNGPNILYLVSTNYLITEVKYIRGAQCFMVIEDRSM